MKWFLAIAILTFSNLLWAQDYYECLDLALSSIEARSAQRIKGFPRGIRLKVLGEAKYYLAYVRRYEDLRAFDPDAQPISFVRDYEFLNPNPFDPSEIDISLARTYRYPNAPILLSNRAYNDFFHTKIPEPIYIDPRMLERRAYVYDGRWSIFRNYKPVQPKPIVPCKWQGGADLLLQEILDHIVPVELADVLSPADLISVKAQKFHMSDNINTTLARILLNHKPFTGDNEITREGYQKFLKALPPELR